MSVLNTMEIKLPKAACEAINLLSRMAKAGYTETFILLEAAYVEVNEEKWKFSPLPVKLKEEMENYMMSNSKEFFELNAWQVFPEMWESIIKTHKNGRSRKLIKGEEKTYPLALTEFIAINAIKYWFKC